MTLLIYWMSIAPFIVYSAKSSEIWIQVILVAIAVIWFLTGIIMSLLELQRIPLPSPGPSLSVPVSDFGHAITQLAKNYDILRAQTTQAFVIASIMMVFGVCVILIGVAGELFGLLSK